MASRDVVFLGPPGSGKGTQADLLAARYGLVHLSTGELFRENVRKGTPRGRQAQVYMDRGEYVPDPLTVAMVMERLSQADAAGGVIFDGFPRTREQALALAQGLGEHGRAVEAVIEFEVDEAEIIKRLSARRVCPRDGATYNLLTKPPREANRCDLDGAELVQREDDKPETIRRRLQVYCRQTTPLLEYYRSQGLLRAVNGLQSVAEVHRQVIALLGWER